MKVFKESIFDFGGGVVFKAPLEYHYATIDKNGMVCAYKNPPEIDNVEGIWYCEKNGFLNLGIVDLEGMDWRDCVLEETSG